MHAPACVCGSSAKPNAQGDIRVVEGASSRLALLKDQVRVFQEQLDMDAADVEDSSFRSPMICETWLRENGVIGKIHLFVGPISLLSLSDVVRASEDEATTVRGSFGAGQECFP